jgi:hypothetical protein
VLFTRLNLKTAVAGLKMAHIREITLAFEFSALTLTVPGLRAKKFQSPARFRVSAPFSFSLTAVFRVKEYNLARCFEFSQRNVNMPGNVVFLLRAGCRRAT